MEEDLLLTGLEGYSDPEPEPIAEENSFFSNDQYSENNDEQSFDDSDKDYLDMLLSSKGLSKDNIQVYDENNNIVSVSFDSLSDQEKFDLLSSQQESALPTDDEIETLNYLRKNNMSLEDFADYQKQLGIQEYMNSQIPKSDIDTYSDDEIIAYDIIKRFGDQYEDADIDAEIDRLKENPDAFQKKVSLLREMYKQEEANTAKLYQQQQEAETQEKVNNMLSSYSQALNDMGFIQGIELDDDDKNELFQFVLQKDQNGQTEFSKLLNDPDSVLKMAWFALHGEDAMTNVVDYFKKEITKRENSGPRVVNRNTKSTSTNKTQFKFD